MVEIPFIGHSNLCWCSGHPARHKRREHGAVNGSGLGLAEDRRVEVSRLQEQTTES
jgi:hypothetical protein